MAQGPPLEARIFFQNPPPDLTFPTGSPIIIVFQVRNTNGEIITTEGFSTELWRQLSFRDPLGNLVANSGAALVHRDIQVIQCHSRQGVLEGPTTLSLFPVERVPPTFAQEYIIDVTRFFDLTRPGRWRAQAEIPLVRFNLDPNTVVTDCDQLAGTGVNVGTDPGSPGTASTLNRQVFIILSNILEFIITKFKFPGFNPPIVNDSDPACTSLPCKTYKANSTLPVKFPLFNENGELVTNATPRIRVEWVSTNAPPVIPEDLGTSAADSGDLFRFDGTQYIYNLKLALQPGTYKVSAILDDGVAHSAHFGVR